MNTKPVPTGGKLQTGDVILRPIKATDAELLRRWRGRDDVRIWFGDTGKVDTAAQQAWMTRYLAKKDDAMFIIGLERNGNKLPVGAVAIYDINQVAGTAEYGRVMIGEDVARGKAVAERASSLLCNWALGDLGLKRIVLWVIKENQRAIDLYERLGFVTSEPSKERHGYQFMTLEKSSNG
ncbi:MAG: GNAT family N-acetyltransferase [Rhizobiaceae bacterium]